MVAPAKKLCANYVGKPVKDEGDTDYVPSLFSYSKTKAATTHSRICRYQRLMQRRTLAPVSKHQHAPGVEAEQQCVTNSRVS